MCLPKWSTKTFCLSVVQRPWFYVTMLMIIFYFRRRVRFTVASLKLLNIIGWCQAITRVRCFLLAIETRIWLFPIVLGNDSYLEDCVKIQSKVIFFSSCFLGMFCKLVTVQHNRKSIVWPIAVGTCVEGNNEWRVCRIVLSVVDKKK